MIIVICDTCGTKYKAKMPVGESLKIPANFPKRIKGVDICDNCPSLPNGKALLRQRCRLCWSMRRVTLAGNLYQHGSCRGGGRPGLSIVAVEQLEKELYEWVAKNERIPLHRAARTMNVARTALWSLPGIRVEWSKTAVGDPNDLNPPREGAPILILMGPDKLLWKSALTPETLMSKNTWGYALWPMSIFFLPKKTFAFFGTLKAARLELARAQTDASWWKRVCFVVLPGGTLH